MLPFAAALMLAAVDPQTSPAVQKIAQAREAIARSPRHVPAHNQLAMAFAQRARETSDPAYYVQAAEILEQSLALEPDNFEARKIEAWVLLGRHEFARALEAAKKLNARVPDDVMVYGLLTDAAVELGLYTEAEESAQWMLNLRPGTVGGLTRGAYLRELFGDVEGAVEFMEKAYRGLDQDEVEDRAWVLTQIAHLRLGSGKVEAAERTVVLALDLFPEYHYALETLARVRSAQGRYADAVELLRRRYDLAPHPENLYALARALEQSGRFEEARGALERFEQQARGEMASNDNANHDLVFLYADHKRRPAEALRIATLEMARRQDVHTRHAYAWALHRAGRHREALTEMRAALSVGIRDAVMLYRAGIISVAAKNPDAGMRYLRESIQVNPASEVADNARKSLKRLGASL